MKNYSILIALTLMFVLNSCGGTSGISSSVNPNPIDMDVPDGKALIYLYRKSSFAFAVGFSISCNGEKLASFYPKKYYLLAVDPGEYQFESDGLLEGDKDMMILAVESNKKYYVDIIPKMGVIVARCEFRHEDESKGIKNIRNCSLVGMNQEAKNLLNYHPK